MILILLRPATTAIFMKTRRLRQLPWGVAYEDTHAAKARQDASAGEKACGRGKAVLPSHVAGPGRLAGPREQVDYERARTALQKALSRLEVSSRGGVSPRSAVLNQVRPQG